MPRTLCLAAVVVAATGATAAADTGALIQESARGAVARTRRSIVLGPTVGVGGAYLSGPDQADAPLTFGIAFRKLKIPWLDRDELKDIAVERALEGGDLKDMVRDVGGEVLDRVTGKKPFEPKTLHDPSLAVTIEGAKLLDTGDWQVRGVVGFGIWKVTLGPVITGHLGDADGLLLGGEVAVHLTPWDQPRSPMVDLYVRGELGVTGQVDQLDVISVGTRLIYDLI